MDQKIFFDPNLTKADRLVLEGLANDIDRFSPAKNDVNGGDATGSRSAEDTREATQATLNAINNPKDARFEPSIYNSTDYDKIDWKKPFNRYVLQPYLQWGRSVVRVETDVVMLTHLLLYFTTSIPSALTLFFYHFTWYHGILHFVMQVSYMGTYTLMMHQHIHGRGILAPRFAWFDRLFPYVTDPLMGHTWNSYFYHHVKHHHVEGNGPDDLSSTVRYQRDNGWHFLHYLVRFFFLVWFDLPGYFLRKGQTTNAAKVAFWELGSYVCLSLCYVWKPNPTTCVFLLPLLLLRIGLMVGNWGQHAFVDDVEPDSDYRSSITLIDVQSNRHSFNDGYHTSHHLNPLRHWREHPNSFFKSKDIYASEGGLVFHKIDYIEITIRLLIKDYRHLAECMVPIGEEQIKLTMEERMAKLRSHTRAFTEDEIKVKFGKQS